MVWSRRVEGSGMAVLVYRDEGEVQAVVPVLGSVRSVELVIGDARRQSAETFPLLSLAGKLMHVATGIPWEVLADADVG